MKKRKNIRNIEKKALNIPSEFLKKLGSHISQVGGLYVHTPTQLKKKSKTYLIKEILRLEKIILRITYNAYKLQLPRLRTTRQKVSTVPLSWYDPKFTALAVKATTRSKKKHWIDRVGKERFVPLTAQERQEVEELKIATQKLRKTIPRKRKKLTGAAKAKFLARMNKGRRRKGLKPIRSR